MKLRAKAMFILSVSIFFSLLISCDQNRIYENNVEVENAIWAKSEPFEFIFDISNTEELYKLSINIRNKSAYEYSNLFLFVEMTSPDDKYFADTLELNLTDNTGRWTGSGAGNIWLNQFPLFEGVKMLVPGSYKIKIGHGMRDDSLQAISDVGIRVETI